MNTQFNLMISAYGANESLLSTKMITLERDLSNVPAIEVYVKRLEEELLPEFKKKDKSIARLNIDKLFFLGSNGSMAEARIVWPKPDTK